MRLPIQYSPLLFCLCVLACKQPVLNEVVNTTVYPRQVLGVAGSDLFGTSVLWDAGLASQASAKTSFLSARYFQVPDAVAPGVHPVRLRNSKGSSAAVIDVTSVAANGTFPAPRIEEIGLFNILTPGSTTPAFWLSVPAANGDIDGKVLIDGVEVPTIMYSAIPSDFLIPHTPATYGYPIYHYTQYVAIVEDKSYGSTVSVRVENHDGTRSPARSYRLPVDYASRDSDGDGLLDEWEINGYTAPSGGTIDLAAFGCDPHRKDLLVEVDWIAAAVPQNGIWATVEAMFANAPVLNPDGSQGISAWIDRGQGGAFTGGGTVLANHSVTDWVTPPGSVTGFVNFDTYKSNGSNFDPDRRAIFHYNVFGRGMPGGFSGRGEIWGNDFLVTFRNFSEWSSAIAQAGTFLHELGHNLSWRHGGIDNGAADANLLYKANFHSTMNYRYQFPGISVDCDVTPDGVVGFSEGIFRDLHETTVTEATGICDNTAIDYNCDGDFSDSGPLDINRRPGLCPGGGDGSTNGLHQDYDQWGNLQLDLDSPSSRWRSN